MDKFKECLIFLVGLYLISFSSAWSTSTFDSGLTIENLTYNNTGIIYNSSYISGEVYSLTMDFQINISVINSTLFNNFTLTGSAANSLHLGFIIILAVHGVLIMIYA